MQKLTWIFLIVVFGSTAVRLWLLTRQARAVGAHRDHVPEPFSDAITLAEHQKAADYTLAQVRLSRLEVLFDSAVLLLLTLGGGISFIDRISNQFPLSAVWQGVWVMLALFLLLGLVHMPFSLWRTFRIEARFGFNRTTLKTYCLDMLKSTLVGLILGVPLLWAILFLMISAGTAWWVYAWILWTLFGLLISWAWPVVIAPLFNKFTPLQDADLENRIRALLARCQFSSAGVFVMDGSARSAHGNAYFTGFGRSKRIVFFDTLIARLAPDELEAVLAHELGHYRLHHVRKQMLASFVFSFIGLAVLGMLAPWPAFYSALGVERMSAHAALLLFLLCSGPFLYFLTPISTAWSRRHEFAADRFAAQNTPAEQLITALVKLYRDNATTLTPDVVHSRFYDSHPPALERIQFLRSLVAVK